VIHGKAVPLPAPVIVESERILVTVQSLPILLDAFINAKTVLHASGRRLFVNLTGISVWQELKSADPGVPESKSHVVLTFPSSVSPTIFESGNQLHMIFTREPVLPGSDITFTDPAIREIHFQENNGTLEVIITGTVPLTANATGSGKQITVSASRMPFEAQGDTHTAPTAAPTVTPELSMEIPTPQDTASQTSGTPESGSQGSTQGSSSSGPIPMATVLPKLLIVIDAGHGGSDPGARISGTLAEKDIVLAVARRLRTELQNRGFITIMARDSDNATPIDQRATLANATHPVLYINLHANATETGVHVYTSLLRPASPPPVFPTWDTAQAGYVERSEHIASMVADSLNQANLSVALGRAALRPLDNIAAPAIAVEFSPQGGVADQITDAGYQENLAHALANALAANRLELAEAQ
jgi:N-acetylmuramoyl-L-alanine amidase